MNLPDSELTPTVETGAIEAKPGRVGSKSDLELLKIDAEINKLQIDAKVADKQLRTIFINALIAPLVPFTALMALIVTIWVNSLQADISLQNERQKSINEANNRTETLWQSFIDKFDEVPANDLYRRPTFIANIQAYAEDLQKRRKLQIILRVFLTDLSSSSAFIEIYQLIMNPLTKSNAQTIISVARSKNFQMEEIIKMCKEVTPDGFSPEILKLGYGICSAKISDSEIKKLVDNDLKIKKISEYRNIVADLESIGYYLSQQISAHLRLSYKEYGKTELDLSRLYIFGANFRDTDLSVANFSYTVIADSELAGTILESSLQPSRISNSNWWEAKSISPDYLGLLIEDSYPGSLYNANSDVDFNFYHQNVTRLCGRHSAEVCKSLKCLPFGSGDKDSRRCAD